MMRELCCAARAFQFEQNSLCSHSFNSQLLSARRKSILLRRTTTAMFVRCVSYRPHTSGPGSAQLNHLALGALSFANDDDTDDDCVCCSCIIQSVYDSRTQLCTCIVQRYDDADDLNIDHATATATAPVDSWQHLIHHRGSANTSPHTRMLQTIRSQDENNNVISARRAISHLSSKPNRRVSCAPLALNSAAQNLRAALC